VNGAPICGGGNGSRTAQWQQVMIAPDCQRCAKILARQRNAALTKPQPTK
jgi:hypothetical protein